MLAKYFSRPFHRHVLQRSLSTTTTTNLEMDFIDLFEEIPPERIRNFSIIAHVDHGKSTLADRLLEFTGAIKTIKSNKQVLDSLKVEQERGITVKSQTASLIYHDPKTKLPYLLNLIDTPGHVDFSYEVSRSLAACQGALLLVDSTQGVQAQTLANYRTAMEANLTIIPCLTKLDLPHSDPAKAIEQIEQAFGFEEDDIIWTSAKSGEGVDEIPSALIERIPPPPLNQKDSPFRGLIVDSWHNSFRGVTCLLSTVDGTVSKGDEISMASTNKKFEVQEVGLLTPNALPVQTLSSGHVGYLVCGMKDTADARVGDTLIDPTVKDIIPLPGFRPVKAMLFSSVYPVNANDFDDLRQALDRLILNDSSVTVQAEASTALGQGFRCGFLGKLHMEVFHQRLMDEHGQQVISTAPMVRKTGGADLHLKRIETITKH
jgi:translation factor GUF1, mitochondrial